MPGQVAALMRRIEILGPARDRCLLQLEEATHDAAAQSATEEGAREAGRALKRAARLRTEIATVTGEIETLRSLVAARQTLTPRQR
jgi:hypothetical protein